MKNQKSVARSKVAPTLGYWAATSIVVGILIGSGVFVKPAKVLEQAGSPTLAILAWVFGGLLTLAGALTVSELAARRPQSGGLYIILQEAYGSRVAFLCGWIQSLIYGPALVAALSLYFASLLHGLWVTMPVSEISVAIVTAALLTAINARSTSWGALLQQAATFLKIIPILLISFVGLFFFTQTAPMASAVVAPAAGFSVTTFGAAVLSTLWAYDGWILVTNVTSEVRNPTRTIPRALISGISFVIAAYIAVNLVLFKILGPANLLMHANKAAIVVAEQLFGQYGGTLISVGILISILGCLNGCVLTGPRVPHAMSKRGHFLFASYFCEHPLACSPKRNLILQLVIALTYMSMAAADFLTDLALFGLYCFITLAFTAIFIFRKKDGLKQSPFRTPLYPGVPLVAIVSCLYVLVASLLAQPKLFVFTLGVLAAGWLVYEAACKNAPELIEEFT